MPDAAMPDPGLIVGTHLRAHPRVTALVDQRSSLRLATTMPAIRYAVTSNPKRGPEEWAPTVQVECWAVKDEQAWEIATAVASSLPDLPGVRATGQVVQADVTNVFTSPDPDTQRPRVIVLVSVLLFALDPVEFP